MKNAIQKIIIAAVFFAAGLFNISANAQQASQAGLWQNLNLTSRNGIDLGQPIPDIVSDVMDLGGDFANDFPVAMGLFYLQNQNDGCDSGDIASIFNIDNNEWRYSSFIGPVLVGHVLRHGPFGDPFADMLFSLRVYRNSGGDSQIAQPILDSPATGTDCSNFMQTQTVAATAGANQFFLDDNFEPTQDVCEARDVSPVCPPPPNCGTGTTGTANAQNECECATDELPILQDDGGNNFSCRAIESAADCPGATPDFVNGNCVAACESDETRNSAGICQTNPQDNTETGTNPPGGQNPTTQTPQNRADNKERRVKSINTATGLLAVGVIAVFLAGGVPSFNMSPDFGYRITESGYYANVGGRADFRKDNWHLYYSANQQNANGNFADFRYESGGKYTADFWTATFSESVSGETADYNFSLSANLQGEIWKISPVYRLHSEYEKGETETQNELNLQGNFRYNRWTIRPSAGFRWENANDFSKNARFQINAIHRF